MNRATSGFSHRCIRSIAGGPPDNVIYPFFLGTPHDVLRTSNRSSWSTPSGIRTCSNGRPEGPALQQVQFPLSSSGQVTANSTSTGRRMLFAFSARAHHMYEIHVIHQSLAVRKVYLPVDMAVPPACLPPYPCLGPFFCHFGSNSMAICSKGLVQSCLAAKSRTSTFRWENVPLRHDGAQVGLCPCPVQAYEAG